MKNIDTSINAFDVINRDILHKEETDLLAAIFDITGRAFVEHADGNLIAFYVLDEKEGKPLRFHRVSTSRYYTEEDKVFIEEMAFQVLGGMIQQLTDTNLALQEKAKSENKDEVDCIAVATYTNVVNANTIMVSVLIDIEIGMFFVNGVCEKNDFALLLATAYSYSYTIAHILEDFDFLAPGVINGLANVFAAYKFNPECCENISKSVVEMTNSNSKEAIAWRAAKERWINESEEAEKEKQDKQ